MEFALITVEKIVELFVILLIGVIAFKLKVLDSDSNKHLSNFLLKIVTPCILFMSYQIDFDMDSLIGLSITALLSVLSFVMTIVLADLIIPKKGNPDMAVERTAAVFSNAGFIGIPLINALVGREGVFYLTAYLTVFHLFFWTYGYSLISGVSSLKTTLKNLIQPATVAIVIGLICFILRIRLPGILAGPLNSVADLNTALAMIVAGCNLADSDIMASLKRLRPYFICLVKLILCPAVVILVLRFIPVPMILRTVVAVAVSCPTATMCTMVAVQFDNSAGYCSMLFTLSTLLSLITIPCMMVYMTFIL